MKRRNTRWMALSLCIALASGCTPRPSDPADNTDTSLLNVPGIYDRGDGSVTAVGMLIRISEGPGTDYWALVDQSPNPASSALPPIVAVIANPENELYARRAGLLLAMHGTISESADASAKATGLRVEDVAFLGSDESDIDVKREVALEKPGLYSTTDGRLIAVGETTFYDTSTPGERIWALRYPAQDARQSGVSYVAVLANHAELSLGDGLVAVEGLQVDGIPGSMGTPRMEVERILDTGELAAAHSKPTTTTVLEAEPADDAPGLVDLAGARQLAPPGVRDLPSGRTQVIGILERYGNGWRISTRLPTATAEPMSEPVALDGLGTFRHMPTEDLEGDYVVAEGTLGTAATQGQTTGTLRATSLDRIENVLVFPQGKSLRGIPYRWARVEKPGLFEIGGDRVRLVGMLYRGGPNERWQVPDKMPFSPGMFGSAAYLEEGFEPTGDPESWYGTYVAIEGTKAGEIHRHGLGAGEAASAVVRAETVDRIQVPKRAIEELLH